VEVRQALAGEARTMVQDIQKDGKKKYDCMPKQIVEYDHPLSSKDTWAGHTAFGADLN
jgi:hypothetical protein